MATSGMVYRVVAASWRHRHQLWLHFYMSGPFRRWHISKTEALAHFLFVEFLVHDVPFAVTLDDLARVGGKLSAHFRIDSLFDLEPICQRFDDLQAYVVFRL